MKATPEEIREIQKLQAILRKQASGSTDPDEKLVERLRELQRKTRYVEEIDLDEW